MCDNGRKLADRILLSSAKPLKEAADADDDLEDEDRPS
jgi:hypothetical protein